MQRGGRCRFGGCHAGRHGCGPGGRAGWHRLVRYHQQGVTPRFFAHLGAVAPGGGAGCGRLLGARCLGRGFVWCGPSWLWIGRKQMVPPAFSRQALGWRRVTARPPAPNRLPRVGCAPAAWGAFHTAHGDVGLAWRPLGSRCFLAGLARSALHFFKLRLETAQHFLHHIGFDVGADVGVARHLAWVAGAVAVRTVWCW